jgi:hypothetical protein
MTAPCQNAPLNVLPATSAPSASVSKFGSTGCRPDLFFTVLGGDDEKNVAGRCAVAAAGGSSLGRVLHGILRHIQRVSLVQHAVSMMRANLLVAIAVLLMSAGAARTYKEEPFSIMNSKGIARSRYAGEWNCGMNMKLIMDKGKQKLDTKITCVDKKNGKFMAGFDEYLILTPKKDSPCAGKKLWIDYIERVDKNAYLVFTTDCKAKRRSALYQALDDTLLITATENY